MPRAQIYLFGSPRIEADGVSVDAFPTRRSAYLLAMLALNPKRRVARRQLAAVLWPDEPYETTSLRLRQELSRLRKALGGASALLASDLVYVSLEPGATETDVERFQNLLKQAKEDEHLLREAIDLSGEPLLEGVLEEWAVEERRRLSQLRYAALVELGEIHGNHGEIDEALQAATEAIKLMPFREDAYQLQVRLLNRSGQEGAALGQLQALRRLASDSGRPRLVTFAEDLADNIRQPAALAMDIVGRDDESERLRSWLHPERGKARLVTLLGPGGVGKTHLLTRTCQAMGGLYNGHVTLVDLSEIDQSRFVPDAILGALDLGYVPSADPYVRLESAFPKQPFLLALDNLEQFGTSIGALISRLLRSHPHLRILASSRTAINVQEEFRLPLSPLQVPAEEQNREDSFQSPAVRLFLEAAENAGARLGADETDWSSVFKIVRKLEGMPLSLRLAAPRLRSQEPAELLHFLEVDPWISATETDVPERHRSLHNALAGSFDLLPLDLREAAADLSVFRGGWTNEAASRVCGFAQPETVMGALLDASLIERITEGGQLRFRMLESVQAFAASLLPMDRSKELRRRHLDWVLEITDRFAGKPVDERMLGLFTQLEREADNLREAMRHALATDAASAFRLAGNLGPFWFHRTSGFEASEIYRELFDRHGQLPPTKAMVRATLGQSWIAHLIAFPGKPELYQRGIELGRAVGDRTHEASFLALKGLYAQNAMQYELGDDVMREIERVESDIGLGEAEGTIFRLKGLVAMYRGELPVAIQLFRESVKCFRSRGEVFGYASARLHLVQAATESGDFDLATAMIDGLLEDIQRIRFDVLIPAVHSMQGNLDAGRGRLEEAIRSLAISRDLWQRQGAVFRAVHQEYDIGRARFVQGRFVEAGQCFANAAERWNEAGHPFAAAIALVGVSGSFWKCGEAPKARRLMACARAQFEISQARVIESQLQFEKELLAEMGEDVGVADLSIEEAISIAHTAFASSP